MLKLAFTWMLLVPLQAALAAGSPSLAQSEYVFDTAEQHKIRVTVVVRGLKTPWAIAFLPTGDALVSERGGQLRLINNALGTATGPATLAPEPIAGVPILADAEQTPFKGGLHEVILHPQFEQNRLVYLTINRQGTLPGRSGPNRSLLSIVRGKLTGHVLTDVKEIYVAAATPSGIRMAFGKDGMLYVTTGTMFDEQPPQQLDDASGKILRLKEDGTVPADNPFVGRREVLPEIYSYGHSTQYGLAVHPGTGALLNAENGPNGGDEVNLILPGRNYGWPLVSYGRKDGPKNMGNEPYASAVAPGIESPLFVWLPGIVPTGMVVYSGERIPAWKGNLFVGSLHPGHLPGTGGVVRVVLDAKLGDLRREMLLTELHQRIRDVRQGPDGLLYVLAEGTDAELLRIEPAS